MRRHLFSCSRRALWGSKVSISQSRFQSRNVEVVGIDAAAASKQPTPLNVDDLKIKAALSMREPQSSSYAIASITGMAHDVQVGQINDDVVIQFAVCCNYLHADVHAAAAVSDLQSLSGGGGGSTSQQGSKLAASTSNLGKQAPPSAAAPTRQSFRAPHVGANNSAAAASTSSKGGASDESNKSPAAILEASRNTALARQAHLHENAKDIFWVRCFGGEEELISLQSKLLPGDIVRVEGNFKMNCQKDPALLRNTHKNGERRFPYIRVDLGDRAAYNECREHIRALEENTEGSRERRGRSMAPPKGTHSLVKTGCIELITRVALK